MEKGSKYGPMKQFILANIETVRSTEKENSCGLMTVPTREISFKTIFKGLVDMSGKTVEFMKEIG